jgi:Tfp pilus assembly protein PilN
MRQINLLPSEIAQRRRAREITLLIAAGGAVLMGLLVLVFLVQTARVAGERGKLEDIRRENAGLQRQVDRLQAFATLQKTLQTKQQLLGQLTRNEVRWSILLNDVSLVIPSDVWLTNFTGSVQTPTGPQPANVNAPIGTIALGGSTFTHLDVAKWLSRLSIVREFAFPYLTMSAKGVIGDQPIVSFNSSVELSTSALRRNQPGGERKP